MKSKKLKLNKDVISKLNASKIVGGGTEAWMDGCGASTPYHTCQSSFDYECQASLGGGDMSNATECLACHYV